MDILQSLSPMVWLILISATLIVGFTLFAKAIKLTLKLAIMAVMALVVIYFLRQANII